MQQEPVNKGIPGKNQNRLFRGFLQILFWQLQQQFNRRSQVRQGDMLIRDRIFSKLEEKGMTQKSFSEKTGIPQSTISDWRKKKTNPTAEKIMIICKVLDVTPEWLLSGIEPQGERGNPRKLFAVDAETDAGQLLISFNSMDAGMQERILGYAEALSGRMRKNR